MCDLCKRRPHRKGDFLCRPCRKTYDGFADESRPQETPLLQRAFKVAYWRGAAIVYVPEGDYFRPVFAGFKSPEKLPKGKLLNLDEYIPGYSREQIKAMKADFKALVPLLR